MRGFPDPIRCAAGRRHRRRRDAVPVEGAREAALLIRRRRRFRVRRRRVDVCGEEGAEPARGVLRGRAEHRGGQAPSPLRYPFSPTLSLARRKVWSVR